MERIQVKHIKQVLGRSEDVPIINVLSKEEFQKEHIPQSINIPFKDSDQFLQEVEKKVSSKDHKVIVYCASRECDLSEKAAKSLDKAGFSYVMDFERGIKDWKEAGEEVISK
jgi:rhodanese-related sulfurtransferase